MKYGIAAIVIVLLLAIFGPTTLYTVDETQMVVITRFGDIKSINTSPGLKAKLPFVDQKNTFDKRVLRIDIAPATLNDVEKQNLVIDAYVRYQIKPDEVRNFFEKLRTLAGAESRLESIVAASLKREVARKTRQEIIGGRIEEVADGDNIVIATDTRQAILDSVIAASNREVGPKLKYVTAEDATKLDIPFGDEDLVEVGEESLIRIDDSLAETIDPDLIIEIGEDLGVEIVDVRIKKAEFPSDALPNIFARMRAERDRISRELRAEGAEEDAKIRADVNRRTAIIRAEAGRQANLTRGEGEAQAIEIFAKALEQDPEFFAFTRSLEAYKQFLATNTTVVLSSDAELFQFLQSTDFIDVQVPKVIVGTIDAISGNLWTVGGEEVSIIGGTSIDLGFTPQVGNTIFIEGDIDADGNFVAAQVLEGISGRLDLLSVSELVVDDQTFAIDLQISPKQPGQVNPVLVVLVYVVAQGTGDIIVADQLTEGIRGTLTSTGDRTWTVGTTEVEVNGSTVILEGADVVGEELLLSVERQPDDSLVALTIGPEILVATGDSPDRYVGAASSVVQDWVVSGSVGTITVNDNTDIQIGADQAGLEVLIGFQRQLDGSLLAVDVRIR